MKFLGISESGQMYDSRTGGRRLIEDKAQYWIYISFFQTQIGNHRVLIALLWSG